MQSHYTFISKHAKNKKENKIYIINQSIIETKQLHQYNYNITYLVDYNNMTLIQYNIFSRL